jgi:hypothetical protein
VNKTASNANRSHDVSKNAPSHVNKGPGSGPGADKRSNGNPGGDRK